MLDLSNAGASRSGRAVRRRRALAAPVTVAGLLGLAAVLAGWCAGCGGGDVSASPATPQRVIVLGFDGMDYDLTKKLMDEGRMPSFSRLAAAGQFQPLLSAIPPQSPVAWSNFITGMDAGGHGIYDFLHRNPKTYLPYLSTSRAETGEPLLTLGKWQVPGSGKVELLRHGEPFWEALGKAGVDTTIDRMPANFPPSGTASRELSGMGAPDLQGTPGWFSFYTSELFAFSGQDISNGDIHEVDAFDDVVHASLYGPDNPFLKETKKATFDFTAYLDPEADVAKIVVGDEERILQVGEWSDWVPFEFDLVPTQHVPAMVRFYLKQVHPEFELYASPVNIDPEDQALPVSYPDDYAAELARATGRFYTQGMPEETNAYKDGVLDRDEFLAQAAIAGDEIAEQYKYVLDRFEKASAPRRLLFYYFGNTDQVSHMMWVTLDPSHPAYDPEVDPKYADVIPKLYQKMDGIVGYTLDHMSPDTTLVVMSDHGFTSWRRAFNLNAWLRDHGFLAVKNPDLREDPGYYGNVDWARTKAYGLGLNGLYINLQGREAQGIVPPARRRAVMEEIRDQLLATRDPKTGEPAVGKVYFSEDVYEHRGYLDLAPDIQVGYAKGTRVASESATGTVGREVFSDNLEPWTGDHCMETSSVPGILLASRPLPKKVTSLKNLAAAIVAEYGIEQFPPPYDGHPAP